MTDEYKPVTVEERLGYLVEECGEVMAAVGKSLRFGLEAYNPELPDEEIELNKDWVLRELKDLTRAIKLAREILREEAE